MELQTSLHDSKEEVICLKEATERRLEEASAQWDEERRKMSHNAEQDVRVSVTSHVHQTLKQ